MIIRRYLTKEVAVTTLVVTLILTFLMAGSRLIKYFGYAAIGKFDASVLLPLVAYRLPDFLVLLFPLAFFIGIMLAFGRMYVDNEITIFKSVGLSREQLAGFLIPLTFILWMGFSALTIDIAPLCLRQSDKLLTTQAMRGAFDIVQAGEMKTIGDKTIYTNEVNNKDKSLNDVFFYQKSNKADKPDIVILSKKAVKIEDTTENINIIDLFDGRRYELYPNSLEYAHTEFSYYRLRLPNDKGLEKDDQTYEAKPWLNLLDMPDDHKAQAEIGWRLTIPCTLWFALLFSIPLAEVEPRKGRFVKLFPSVVVYASLIFSLSWVKSQIIKNNWPVTNYLVVLAIYFVMCLIIILIQNKSFKKIKQGAQT